MGPYGSIDGSIMGPYTNVVATRRPWFGLVWFVVEDKVALYSQSCPGYPPPD